MDRREQVERLMKRYEQLAVQARSYSADAPCYFRRTRRNWWRIIWSALLAAAVAVAMYRWMRLPQMAEALMSTDGGDTIFLMLVAVILGLMVYAAAYVSVRNGELENSVRLPVSTCRTIHILQMEIERLEQEEADREREHARMGDLYPQFLKLQDLIKRELHYSCRLVEKPGEFRMCVSDGGLLKSVPLTEEGLEQMLVAIEPWLTLQRGYVERQQQIVQKMKASLLD